MEEPGSDLWYWNTFKESSRGAGVSYLILIAHVVKTILTCIIKHYLCRYQLLYIYAYFVIVIPAYQGNQGRG